MSPEPSLVVAPGTAPGDDELRLPRPPGVIRRFWAAHPRTSDVAIALVALLLSAPGAVFRARGPVPPSAVEVWTAIALAVVAATALVFRRRRPLVVFAVTMLPGLMLPASLAAVGDLTPAIALYAVAVYASMRACWIAFGAGALALAIRASVGLLSGADATGAAVTVDISAAVILFIGALIGINVGNRRRYVDALIARSRQLLVERDQQAQLAAATERTRIAREMHDIVSHSLTVIVALAEGAAATRDPERARAASRGAADTARAALTEMRAMLGVLRDDDEGASRLPDAPPDPRALVSTAQRAGYPVTFTSTGDDRSLSPAVRFALGRVVQEGLTNAMRHAPGARSIRVMIEHAPPSVIITVDDDGTGDGADTGGGFGLRGLRERVQVAGGRLEAGPRDDRGWRVRAVLPRTDDLRDDLPLTDDLREPAAPSIEEESAR
jgi:signal transduction histidine kinase